MKIQNESKSNQNIKLNEEKYNKNLRSPTPDISKYKSKELINKKSKLENNSN